MVSWQRANAVLLLLLLLSSLGIIAMLATRTEGGPLDPPGPPAGTDGVRKPGTPISGPTTITQPGYYYLTRDFTSPPSVDAIVIEANDVWVDLGGFTITRSGPEPSNGIVASGLRERITVTNGTLRGYIVGVAADDDRFVHVEGVTASGGAVAFDVGDDALIENCRVFSVGDGIQIPGNRVTVRNCVVIASGRTGITVEGSAALIERSVIKANNQANLAGFGGITVTGVGRATIRDNDFALNAQWDIIFLSSSNVVIDNVLTCQNWISDSPGGNFYPVNSTDPHTNRSHQTNC
jgi:hypothetical protein